MYMSFFMGHGGLSFWRGGEEGRVWMHVDGASSLLSCLLLLVLSLRSTEERAASGSTAFPSL